MSTARARLWRSLERWRGTAFLIGGGIFVVDAALLAFYLATGGEPAALGQTFVGAAWTAAFVGLLGFNPSLVSENRWLTRIAGFFAVIGGLTMAAMAVTMLGFAANVLAGNPGDVVIFFLPGVFLGIVLGFGLFGVTLLVTDVYSGRVGVLFFVLPATFLFNLLSGMAGFATLATVLGVVVVLALVMLSIGYSVRTGSAAADRASTTASGDIGAD